MLARLMLSAGALFMAATCPVSAQHAGDVFLTVTTGAFPQIRTNVQVPGSVAAHSRVFVGTFGLVGGEVFTDDPGFDSLPGTFPAGSSVTFGIMGALRYWEDGRLDRIPEERLDISFGPLGPVSTPTSDVRVMGFALPVGTNGQWHRHLEYILASPATPGVYALQLRLSSSSPSIGASKTFWFVFGRSADATQVDAAARFVEENLLCEADYNNDDVVNSQDFFDFVSAFFAGDADFNDDNITNSQDYFDFLSAFFSGC